MFYLVGIYELAVTKSATGIVYKALSDPLFALHGVDMQRVVPLSFSMFEN